MERCGNCEKRILFGGVRTSDGAFCSQSCARGLAALLRGFCDACRSQTTDESTGNLTQINGIGTTLSLFDRDKCATCGSIVKTKWFCLVFPLIPLGKYRVLYTQDKRSLTGSSARFLSRRLKPLSPQAHPATPRQASAPISLPVVAPPTPTIAIRAPIPVRSSGAARRRSQTMPAASPTVILAVPTEACAQVVPGGVLEPSSLTVMAVMAIVAGALGLASSGLMLVATVAAPSAMDPLLAAVRQSLAWLTILLALQLADLALVVTLVIGAIGLLQRRRWARATLLVRAVTQIVLTLCQTALGLLLISTTASQRSLSGDPIVGCLVWASTLMALPFNLALIVALSLPSARRALAPRDTICAPFQPDPTCLV
jgi:hypothetical protein